jgi:hypothetical protein
MKALLLLSSCWITDSDKGSELMNQDGNGYILDGYCHPIPAPAKEKLTRYSTRTHKRLQNFAHTRTRMGDHT